MVAAAVIVGVFGIVTTIITGVFGPVGKDSVDAGTSTAASQATSQQPTSAPSPTLSKPIDCSQLFQITQPAIGSRISASQGVILQGTACASDLLWVLDYDPTDGSYFQVNNEPLHVLGGQWTQVDKPIGDPADEIGTVYTIVVMKVTPACSDLLRTAEPGRRRHRLVQPDTARLPDH